MHIEAQKGSVRVTLKNVGAKMFLQGPKSTQKSSPNANKTSELTEAHNFITGFAEAHKALTGS